MGFKLNAEQTLVLNKRGKFPVSEVTHDLVESLFSWIVGNLAIGKTAFTLIISSPGGAGIAAIRFATLLRTLPESVHITGVAVDECGSAALALLQCCHERIGVRGTGFFPHHVQCKLSINCQLPMPEIIEMVEREIATARMYELELAQLQAKRMGISVADWMRIAEHGEKTSGAKYLTDDALRLGMIDKVVDHYQIF
jgi:ATP-dependent protease ClpP protease subunit